MEFSCLVCGVDISGATVYGSERWLQDYRIVYRNGTDVFSVTGVGFHEADLGPEWRAPRDPLLRWDSLSNPNHQIHVPVMKQEAVNGIHGYVLHDACWMILNEACRPAGLSLGRLIAICESLIFPPQLNGVIWGHDYGGVLDFIDKGCTPWQEAFCRRLIQPLIEMGARSHPNDASFVHHLMLPTTTPKPPHLPTITRQSGIDTADPFVRFPWEIREMIFASMRTHDALNLRLASRAFQPLFSSRSFWLSRFEPNGERGFIFEANNREENDWKVETLLHIYHSSRSSLATPELLNRRRIWNLARGLALLIGTPLVGNNPTPIVPRLDTTTTNGQQMLAASDEWVRIVGREEPPSWQRYVQGGCHSTTAICINVPPDAVKVAITIIDTGRWDYVTGIRFIGLDGDEQVAGYVDRDREISRDLSQLHGLRVAMGPGGVRALQIINEGQQASEWIGKTSQVPLCDRLVTEAPITSLRVTLDGYKITGLGIHNHQARQNNTDFLRRTALWYPTIPPDDLLLNDASFTGQHPLSSGYQPLSWIHFGGKQGRSLKKIRSLQIQYSTNGEGFRGFQFLYDDDNDDDDDDKGHGKQQRSGRLDTNTKWKFPGEILFIDGSGGERIESVVVGTRCVQDLNMNPPAFLEQGFLGCLIITTNRGRRVHVGKAQSEEDMLMRPINVAQGSTITGFYGHFDAYVGLINLGVISEEIVDPL